MQSRPTPKFQAALRLGLLAFLPLLNPIAAASELVLKPIQVAQGVYAVIGNSAGWVCGVSMPSQR